MKALDPRLLSAKALAVKADDARHGANQLSQSAQRAPTLEACDEGWQRVENIVGVAVEAAALAGAIAVELEREAPETAIARAARVAADRAAGAARAAQTHVAERNHAYTFHTDNGFSFGEGWYLAAAAVLTGVMIQIEPARPGTPAAERFLLDAGLGARLEPYRPRPRAMKQTTELVARAFRADPLGAQRQLRAAFLGDGRVPSAVRDFIERRPGVARGVETAGKKVLLWIRDGAHHASRNTSGAELVELVERTRRTGLVPVLIGDALRDVPVPPGCIDMILFWKDPIFQGIDMRRAQLQFFEELRGRQGLVGQVGVTTAGMDGPALLGLSTMYLTDAPNVRMGQWVGAVPGYEEVVRGSGYLDRVSERLREWAGTISLPAGNAPAATTG